MYSTVEDDHSYTWQICNISAAATDGLPWRSERQKFSKYKIPPPRERERERRIPFPWAYPEPLPLAVAGYEAWNYAEAVID